MRWEGPYKDGFGVEIRRKVTLEKISIHIWDDNIKIDVRAVGWGYGVGLTGSGSEPVARSCEHILELVG